MRPHHIYLGLVLAVLAVLLSVGVANAAYTHYLPWTNNIYSVSPPESNKNEVGETNRATVSVFDDAGNKCYVLMARQGGPVSISCVPGGR